MQQRDIYLGKIFQCFDNLKKYPFSGKKRNELYDGMRSISVEKYIVYYYYDNHLIKIANILHAQMDPAIHLNQIH